MTTTPNKPAEKPAEKPDPKEVAAAQQQAALKEAEKKAKEDDAKDAPEKGNTPPVTNTDPVADGPVPMTAEAAAEEAAREEAQYQDRVKRAKERAKRLPAYSTQSDPDMSTEERVYYLYGALPETLPDSHILFGLGGVPFRAGDLRALVHGPKP